MHQELQDQDLLGSPHLDERWIGGNVDLDLLSQIPQRYARIMGGNERGASFPRSTMEEREGENSCLEELLSLGKKRPFYRSHEKEPLQENFTPEFPVTRAGNSGQGRKLRPTGTGNSGPHQGLNTVNTAEAWANSPVPWAGKFIQGRKLRPLGPETLPPTRG